MERKTLKKIGIGIGVVVVGATVLLVLILVAFLPTPGQAILKYAVPTTGPSEAHSALNHSGATDLGRTTGASAEASQRVFKVMTAIERDFIRGPSQDVCVRLKNAPQSRFMEKTQINQRLFELLEQGREQNVDPMGEAILQLLEFYKGDPELVELIAQVQREIGPEQEKGLGAKLSFLKLASSWASRISSESHELGFQRHKAKLEPVFELIKFLHENPRFAADVDFVNFCRDLPRLEKPRETLEELIQQKT